MKIFKEENNDDCFELPIYSYEESEDDVFLESFGKEFYEEAEKLKAEYLSSEYAEETEGKCDKTLVNIFDSNTDY